MFQKFIILLFSIFILKSYNERRQLRDVKCAIIQFSEHYRNEVTQDANRLESYIRTAAGNGAKLIVSPENCLYRYDPEVENNVNILELANEFDGLVTRFENLAKELNVCIVFGTREPSGDTKPTYQSAVFIDNNGNLIKTYRKRVPSNAELSYTKAGGGWNRFETPVGWVFMQVCKDMVGDGYVNNMPTNIDLFIGISKDETRGWEMVDAGSAEAGCYSIGANYAGNTIQTGGNSGFVGKNGNVISQAGVGNFGANEIIIYETFPLPAVDDLFYTPIPITCNGKTNAEGACGYPKKGSCDSKDSCVCIGIYYGENCGKDNSTNSKVSVYIGISIGISCGVILTITFIGIILIIVYRVKKIPTDSKSSTCTAEFDPIVKSELEQDFSVKSGMEEGFST